MSSPFANSPFKGPLNLRTQNSTNDSSRRNERIESGKTQRSAIVNSNRATRTPKKGKRRKRTPSNPDEEETKAEAALTFQEKFNKALSLYPVDKDIFTKIFWEDGTMPIRPLKMYRDDDQDPVITVEELSFHALSLLTEGVYIEEAIAEAIANFAPNIVVNTASIQKIETTMNDMMAIIPYQHENEVMKTGEEEKTEGERLKEQAEARRAALRNIRNKMDTSENPNDQLIMTVAEDEEMKDGEQEKTGGERLKDQAEARRAELRKMDETPMAPTPEADGVMDVEKGMQANDSSRMDESDQQLDAMQEEANILEIKEVHRNVRNYNNELKDPSMAEITDALNKTNLRTKVIAEHLIDAKAKIKANAEEKRVIERIVKRLQFIRMGQLQFQEFRKIVNENFIKITNPQDLLMLLRSHLIQLKKYEKSRGEWWNGTEEDFIEIQRAKEDLVNIWLLASEQHPSYFGTVVESPYDFMKRINEVLKRKDKLEETLKSLDILTATTQKLKSLQDEMDFVQKTLKVNQARYERLEAELYDFGEEYKLTEQLFKTDDTTFKDPMYQYEEKKYQDYLKSMRKLVTSMMNEGQKVRPDSKKIEAMRYEWSELYYGKTHVNNKGEPITRHDWFRGFKHTYAMEKQRRVDVFQKFVTREFNEIFKDLGELLFQEHKKGDYYYINPRFNEIFNDYYTLREKLTKDKQNRKEFEEADWDWRDSIVKEAEALKSKFINLSVPTRDQQKIVKDIQMRAKMLKQLTDKKQTQTEKDGKLYTPNEHEIKVYHNLVNSEKTVTAEFAADQVYKVLSKEFPRDWTDATQRLEADVLDLRTAIKDDISSFGPFLNTVVNDIFSKFRSKVQNVSAESRKTFDDAIESEKKYLQKVISKEAYHRTGAKLINATKSKTLQAFVMDPESFNTKDRSQMMTHTPLGMYLSDTRRLLDLVKQSMDLRKRMVGDVMRMLNMEGNTDATKFDVVLSNLFPPSDVELKMRYLMTIEPQARKKYENGRFIQAIKMLDNDFDLAEMTNENFLQKIASISESSKSFLQTVVGPSPISWADFENMANELVRTKATILSQVKDEPVEGDIERLDKSVPPTDKFNYDEDAGAVMNDAGIRVNNTFNPVTQGQITRDKIDDDKRSTYMRMVGSMVSNSLEAADDEPYVPLHTGASKFFFNGSNYTSLKRQYQSMRPLIPKKPMEDPNGFIEETIAYYGPILNVKKRKSSQKDHPSFIQKEANELQELVNAFTNYTNVTAGNYVHDDKPQEAPAAQQAPPEPISNVDPTATNNINPNQTGEETTDKLMSGLQSMFDNTGEVDTGFEVFNTPW